jgi:hypothetical protein
VDTIRDLNEALEMCFYSSRTLLHARRLLALFLLAQSDQKEFFGVNNNSNSNSNDINTSIAQTGGDSFMKSIGVEETNQKGVKFEPKLSSNEFFHSNPIQYSTKRFDTEDEVFVSNDLHINLSTVIESYSKCIRKR